MVVGEVIPVHVNTTRPDLDKHIAESINVTLVNESMDETAVKEIQMPNGLHIVGSTYGRSIVIFIYCKTIDNVVTFTQVFNSGELQAKLEDILNRLFARIEPKSTQRLKSSIRLDDADILEIEEITGIEGRYLFSLRNSIFLTLRYSKHSYIQSPLQFSYDLLDESASLA